MLFADDYGFHHGDVWYRGRFRGRRRRDRHHAGRHHRRRAGAYSAWLNGTFLGTSADGTHTFTFPAGALHVGADNEVSVLVENMGHNEDYNAADSNKEARGLTGGTRLGLAADVDQLAHPGFAGRRGSDRSGARPDEHRRPVRRAGRLVAAGIPRHGLAIR